MELKKTMTNFFKKNLNTILIGFVTSLITFVVLFGSTFAFLLSDKSGLEKYFKSNKTIFVEESGVVDIIEKVNPAVVSIVVTKDVPKIEKYFENLDPFGGSLFDLFNFGIPRYRQNGTEKQEVGGGSGFFVSANGMVVTNKHVVDDVSADYTIITSDGKKHTAKILAKDSVLDIAVLKVDGKNFPYLEFGDSDNLKLGQTVIAIGNALGEFKNSVSVGVISGLSRSITAGDFFGKSEILENVIQTDAAINPGNSGGPLLNVSGQVIGVNVAVDRAAENIGFALSSNSVKNIVESVRKNKEIVRPYLGIRYIPINIELKEANSLPVDYGVLVQRGENSNELAVIPGSPADKAGIEENDIILEIDGKKLDENKSLSLIIGQKKVGDTVRLKIIHNSVEKEVNIRLEKAPQNL